MADRRIDALMLCSGTSLVYFTNIRWSGAERLFTCVVPAKGTPFVVCPAFEEDRAREQLANLLRIAPPADPAVRELRQRIMAGRFLTASRPSRTSA